MKFKTILLAAALVAGFSASVLAEDMKMSDASGQGMAAMDAAEPVPDAAFLAAHAKKLGDLYLYNAFTRAMPPAARAGGGFVTIYNAGATDDRLVSASSPAAKFTQLHNMVMDKGVMIMREFENGIDIPAGAVVALKPGGKHVMFIDAPTQFKQGETVAVTLHFEKAGEITLDLPVGALGSTEMPQ